MNNTFNIHRFGLLLRRKWLEFDKIYLITLGVAMGVIITSYGLATYGFLTGNLSFQERFLDFREPLFLIFGFLFITVIASSYFANLGQKPKAIIDLMIPASTFEKFLTGLFFTALLSTLSFIIIFYLTDLVFVTKIKDMLGNEASSASLFFSKNSPKGFGIKSLTIVIPLFITSVFLLGSIYFNKFHYIKTAISVMVFSGILGFILFRAAEFLFSGKVMIDRGNRGLNHMSQSTGELLAVLTLFILTVIIWSITYVRLKEKEV